MAPLAMKTVTTGRHWLHAPNRWLRARPILYRGSRMTCPLCGRRWRRFRQQGGRPNALCPNPACRTVERHRGIWIFMQRELDLHVDVLHCAPEPALQRLLRERARSYVSVDLDSPLADVHANLEALPFSDSSFDLIMCSHVLEHVRDDHAALRELRRVLRPDGLALVAYPLGEQAQTIEDDPAMTDQERRVRFRGPGHVRLYGQDHVERLQEAGFGVEERPFVAGLSETEKRLYGLAQYTTDRLFLLRPSVPAARIAG